MKTLFRADHGFVIFICLTMLLAAAPPVTAQEQSPPSETPVTAEEATPLPSDEPTAALTESPSNTPTTTDIPTSAPALEVTAVPTEVFLSATPTQVYTDIPTTTALPPTDEPVPTEPPLAVLLSDNFDGSLSNWTLADGWSQVPNEGGQALQASSNNFAPLTLNYAPVLNAAVEARFVFNTGTARLSVRQSAVGGYTASLGVDGQVTLYRADGIVAGAVVPAYQLAQPHTLRLSAMAAIVRVAVDGIEVIVYRDTALLPPGGITVASDGLLTVDDFKLWVPADTIVAAPTPTPTLTPMTRPSPAPTSSVSQSIVPLSGDACAPAALISRVSVASNGTSGNGWAWDGVISGSGRYVAFISEANNLVASDTNEWQDAFVFDRQTCATTRVSVGMGGVQANSATIGVAISYDGRYVAFVSLASNLVPGDTNEAADIFVHDRQTATTSRVSVGTGGIQANDASRSVSISADGRYVAFASRASNLIPDDTNNICYNDSGDWIFDDNCQDIFVHDRNTGQTTRVSVGTGGVQTNGSSDYPSISSDGRYIAFASIANNLVAGDNNICDVNGDGLMESCDDVFVHDRLTGQTILVSASGAGVIGNSRSYEPSISGDGRYIAFESQATNLVTGDTNNTGDIFVRDMVTGQTRRVSVSSTNVQANSTSMQPSMALDGRYVAFVSYASNLVSGDTNGQPDVFMYDYLTKRTVRLSIAADASQANGDSLNYNVPNMDDQRMISDGGQFAAFGSSATNLVSSDTNGMRDFFVRRAAPTAPSNLNVTGVTHNTVSLMWYDNAATEQGFNVYRWDGATGDFVQVGTAAANAVSFTHTSAPCGTQSIYTVAAYADTGESPRALQVAATTTTCPPANDLFANAQAVGTLPYTASQDVYASTVSGTDPALTCIVAGGSNYYANTVWYRYTATANQSVVISTEGSAYDTVLGVFTGSEGSLTPVGCNNDIDAATTASRLSFTVTANTTYRIMIAKWSPDALFQPTNLSISVQAIVAPAAPTLATPANAFVTNDSTPELTWNSVPNGASYQIQIDNTSTFASPERDYIVSDLSYTTDTALPDGLYNWRVRAISPFNLIGAWSAARTFTVDTVPPAVPTLSGPADGSVNTSGRPALSWGAVTSATAYQVQIADDVNFASPIVDVQVTTASYTVTTLLLPNTYYWRVQARDAAGNWSGWNMRSLIVNPMSAPANNTTTTSKAPTFQWTTASGVTRYELQVARDAAFTDLVWSYVTPSGSVGSYVTPAGTPFVYGTYYWRVNTDLGSGFQISPIVWTFTVIPGTPGTPALAAPASGFITNSAAPEFSWNAVVDGDTYQIQIDNNSTFASPERDVIVSSLTYVPDGAGLADGVYSWRVRAYNFLGGVGAWSSVRTATIDTIAPAAPALSAPADSAVLTTARPALSWGTVTSAAQYQVQVDDQPDFASPEAESSPTTTTFTLTASLSQGQYFWRVRARDAASNWGEWTTRIFTVNLLKTPAVNAVITSTTPTRPAFAWYALAGGAGYQIEVATDTGFNDIVYTSPVLASSATSYTPTATENALPFGYYYWRLNVSGYPSVSPVYWAFSVVPPVPAAPTLVSPLNAALTNSDMPELDWNAVNYTYSTLTYEVQVDNNSTFVSPEFTISGVSDLFVNTTVLANGTYSWRVRAVNIWNGAGAWSTARTFTVDTTAPAAPSLSAPANSATVTTARPAMSWVAVTGANLYRVEVTTDENLMVQALPGYAEVTTTSFTPAVSLGQGQYFWRVQARDAAGNWGTWSTVRTFTVNILKTPAVNAVITSTTDARPAFAWYAFTGATSYQIDVAADSAFTNVIYTSPSIASTATTFTIPAASPGLVYGDYYWRIHPGGYPSVSPVFWAFRIVPPVPAAPTLTSPANAALINDNTPDMVWNAVSYTYTALTYEIQIDNNSTFASPEFMLNGITDTFITPDTLADGAYSWRVRAVNPFGGISAWSTTRTLTIDTIPPAVPAMSAPADTAIVTTARPAFSWTASTGATLYRLEVVTNTALASQVIPGFTEVTTTSFTPTISMAQGQYIWRVQARDAAGNWSLWSAPRAFAVNILKTPVNGNVTVSTTLLRPTFTWYAFTSATNYQVEVATDSGFASIVYTSPNLANTVTSHAVPTTSLALPYGTYYWRVNPGGYPSITPIYWSFSIFPPAPSAPTLNAPANATLTNDNTPELSWAAVSYTYSSLTYELQVDNNADFTSPEYTLAGISGLSISTAILPDGNYSWRVRAVNPWNGSSPWSTARTFTVDTIPPDAPPPGNPPASALLTGSRPTFDWVTVSTAAVYRFQMATNSAFTNLIVAGNESATTTFTPAASLGQGVYFWRVQARDAAGNWSAWSEVRSFTINILSAPADSTVLVSTTNARPTFEWFAVPGATGYRIEMSSNVTFTNIVHTSPVSAGLAYTIPETDAGLNYGVYYWRAVVSGFPAVSPVYRTLTVMPPTPGAAVLSLPQNGAALNDATPDLVWTLDYPYVPITYEVQVDDSAAFDSPEFAASGIVGTTATSSALTDGVYFWRVRATNSWNSAGLWSAAGTFTIDTTAPAAPTLIVPENGASVNNAQPAFHWTAVEGAAAYHVELAVESAFAAPMTGDNTANTFTPVISLGQGEYFWRVQARDKAGNWSAWSPVYTFAVNILSVPADAAVLVSTTSARPAFEWFGVADAGGYQVEIAFDSAFTAIVHSSPVLNSGATSYTIPETDAGLAYGSYYWRVTVVGVPAVSPVYRALTVLPPAPDAPVAVSPVGGTMTNNAMPTLSWSMDYPYGWVIYEVQVDDSVDFDSPVFAVSGIVGTSVNAPALVDGSYFWRVRATNSWNDTGSWSAAATFTVDTAVPAAPELASPDNAATLSSAQPTLNWTSTDEPAGYRLEVAADSEFTNLALNATLGAVDTFIPASALGQGQYYWRVQARDAAGNWSAWSAARTFTINILVAPPNGMTIASAANAWPAFEWIAVAGAAGYQVEIASDSAFTTIVHASPVLDSSAVSYTIPETEAGLSYGSYYWRVNVIGIPVVSPVFATLHVVPPVPDAPVLSSPTHGITTNEPTPQLVWEAVGYTSSALTYEVEVDDNPAFDSPEFTLGGLTDLSVTATALADGVYAWRVRAVNIWNVPGAWSDVSTFVVDTTAPDVPSLLTPADSSSAAASEAVFAWLESADAVSYQVALDTANPPATVYNAASAGFTPPDPLSLTTYYWQVRAVDAAGNVSEWSVVYAVTIIEE